MTEPRPGKRAQAGRTPPDPVPAPPDGSIDLTEKQRAIIAQIQADERRLVALESERDQALARLNANRGKLELIAELVAEYGPGQQR
jgi:hypothetical protein